VSLPIDKSTIIILTSSLHNWVTGSQFSHALKAIAFLLANKGKRWHWKTGRDLISQDWVRVEFTKSLYASAFNEDLQYLMTPLSARFISMDFTFKENF